VLDVQENDDLAVLAVYGVALLACCLGGVLGGYDQGESAERFGEVVAGLVDFVFTEIAAVVLYSNPAWRVCKPLRSAFVVCSYSCQCVHRCAR
jgi:hypothetical protein